uniref:class I SAM-dependent methyltransferase n=1 Tax=Candidatus Fimivicinus sp. TaxID=3056640 RepID=UPI003FF0CB45
LSTRLWGTAAAEVIGVEPSLDMLTYAQEHCAPKQNVRFVNAFAHDTGLAEECADVVTCSQSFHWMEPEATLQEVDRILKPGGIFATYDCDWPPVCDRRAEEAYNDLQRRISELASATKDYGESFLRWGKNEHLAHIRESGYFRYAREIVFSNTEECNAQRFINLALSQGGLQTMMRLEPEIVKLCVSRFEKKVREIFEDEIFRMDFCYRMRIGIKDEKRELEE